MLGLAQHAPRYKHLFSVSIYPLRLPTPSVHSSSLIYKCVNFNRCYSTKSSSSKKKSPSQPLSIEEDVDIKPISKKKVGIISKEGKGKEVDKSPIVEQVKVDVKGAQEIKEDEGDEEVKEDEDHEEDEEDEEIEEEIEIDDDENYDGESEYKMEKSNEYLQNYRIGSLTLPDELRFTITETLRNINRKELREHATDLSKRLRDRTTIPIPKDPDSALVIPKDQLPVIPYDKDEATAYIAHRMPGVYGCVYRVFDELATRQPAFAPQSMMDFGSGPGTAVWAASSVWTGHMKRILAVEPSSGMTDAAKKMLEGLPVRWQRYLFEGNTEHLRYDIVSASYVLSELGSTKARRQVVRSLWKAVEPGGFLVLVDAGTPLAFRHLRDLRAMLLQDAKNEEAIQAGQGKPIVIAPCPHSNACPMGANSWCHFVQRVERTPLQLAAKPNSTQSFEDEKFSYFVFQKEPLDKPMPDNIGEFYDEENPIYQNGWSRMVRHPLKRGGHIVLDACTPEGELKRVIVSKTGGKQMFNEARKTSWGDGFIIDKTTKIHGTTSKFMKGVVKETSEEEPSKEIEEKKKKNKETSATVEEEENEEEWSENITEPELKPHPIFQRPTISKQNNSFADKETQTAPSNGPISWARDVLMGKNNNSTEEPNSGAMDTKQQDGNRGEDEDFKSLQKHRHRLLREKAMASKLNEFPSVPKR